MGESAAWSGESMKGERNQHEKTTGQTPARSSQGRERRRQGEHMNSNGKRKRRGASFEGRDFNGGSGKGKFKMAARLSEKKGEKGGY